KGSKEHQTARVKVRNKRGATRKSRQKKELERTRSNDTTTTKSNNITRKGERDRKGSKGEKKLDRKYMTKDSEQREAATGNKHKQKEGKRQETRRKKK
ncbi:13449_t:CDS:1, partial [Gigaspora margarita]